MATEKQNQFFQYLFEQENAREQQLNDYGKNLISLTTLYSGFVLFVAEKMRNDLANGVVECIFVAVVVCMLGGLLLAIIATRMADYQAVNDASEVIEEFGSTGLTDEEFFDNRIADFLVATEWNSDVNDKKAIRLSYAAYALAVGIFLHAVFFIVALSQQSTVV